ncbi:coiled-coil domain-containing protein 170-like [Mytilus edulis]|uniref:coiled-coil domain-containing protein 170-like n=1 Tax=Mytilus edulis TaxID=6550 RepID=UPI0039EF58D4
MASYLDRLEREGLPSIHRSTHNHSERRVIFDDTYRSRSPKCRSNSPTLRSKSPILRSRSPTAISDSLISPRPPSPSHRHDRRSYTELQNVQDQVRVFKDELTKKDALIQQLVSMENVPKSSSVPMRSGADNYRLETVYLGDRHAVESARSELASLSVKYDKLCITVKSMEREMEEKDVHIRELKTLYDTSKENESRLTSLLESHKQQIIELESRTGSFQSAVGRSEFTVSTLQEQNRQNADKIVELEARIRELLESREGADFRCSQVDRKYSELMRQISSVLRIEEYSFESLSVDDISRGVTDLVQENAVLKGKLVTLKEALNSTELETKASRETIMRLVSEVGKEQKVATRYTSDLERLRVERDEAVDIRRSLEREVDVLKERLVAAERAASANRSEIDMREERMNRKERELRTNIHDIQSAKSSVRLFMEQIATLLSEVDDSVLEWSEESIKSRVASLRSRNKEMVSVIESLEERVRALTEQLESQYELHKSSAARARKAESEVADLFEKLRSAEGELSAGDVLRDGFRSDKEKYMRMLQRLGQSLKMDKISSDLGFDLTIDAIISRAEQLVKMEADTIADKSTHIYNLQRKVKSLKEQLESKDLHLDLMRKKMTGMEEKLLGKHVIEKERDSESYRNRKLEKLVEKYKMQLQDASQEIINLKAQLLGSSDIKMRTMEQRQEIDELVKQVEELEELRKRQARKIGALKNEHNSYESSSREKNVVADNAVQALSSELRTTKNSLQTTHNREKQLLDFRNVICRMLGLDINTLAIPDYEIISRLEKLIQAHHTHAFTTMSMEEALADMEDGFVSGYEDYRQTVNTSNQTQTIQRSRERARRKAARARARSASPVRRDHRVY